jgi:hypothetical protein
MITRLVSISNLEELRALSHKERYLVVASSLLLGITVTMIDAGVQLGEKVFLYPFTNLEVWEYLEYLKLVEQVEQPNALGISFTG